MENQSPFLAMQKTEAHVKALLRNVDTDLLAADEIKALASLRRLSHETRLDIRDYELSETRAEQLKKAALAHKSIEKMKADLLAATDVFGPADIAQLDAGLEQIRSRII